MVVKGRSSGRTRRRRALELPRPSDEADDGVLNKRDESRLNRAALHLASLSLARSSQARMHVVLPDQTRPRPQAKGVIYCWVPSSCAPGPCLDFESVDAAHAPAQQDVPADSVGE